jgi:hypothetical protein
VLPVPSLILIVPEDKSKTVGLSAPVGTTKVAVFAEDPIAGEIIWSIKTKKIEITKRIEAVIPKYIKSSISVKPFNFAFLKISIKFMAQQR